MKPKFADAPMGEQFGGFGRILVKKHLGKVLFVKVRFDEDDVQLILERKTLENFSDLTAAPVGSCLLFHGEKQLSRSGEPSIGVLKADVASTCNVPFPDKFHGLVQSGRYEDRMLDLLINDESFAYAALITDVARRIREFLWSKGFREFNTGVLQEFFEGGLAQSFTTSCIANGKTYHLNLTSEVKLKRLLVSGFERVFEILQSFRNEGIDPMHSPEFSLLEVYMVGADYKHMMQLTESMICNAIGAAFPDFKVPVIEGDRQRILDFSTPFDTIPFYDLLHGVTGLSEHECCLEEMVRRFPDDFREGMHRFTWIFKLINKHLSPALTRPTFITEIPSGISPFVRVNDQRPSVSERAALVIDGIDVADIYTDENDRSRVEQAMLAQAEWTGREHNKPYLLLLEYGLPQTASIGLGINRLLLALRRNLPKNIKETILYPIK